jgi:large subunit ribosomal protein L1
MTTDKADQAGGDAEAKGAHKEGPPAEATGAEKKRPRGESQSEARAKRGGVKKAAKRQAPQEAPVRKRGRGRPMRGRSKRHLANLEKVDTHKQYAVEEGIKLLKEVAGGTKFTQSVNMVMNLGIDPKHADQMIRGAVSLPKGIGKTKRVIAFCEGEDAEKAKAAGAMEVGLEDLVKKISDGWMDFDVAISHPRAMSKVGKLGRILGPQGKMPTPKNGTVTPNVEEAVREFAAGKIEFRNDAGANVHVVVGKVDFPDEDLKENILAFVDHIRKLKPVASKGAYIKKVCISGTMSPAVELQIAQH